MRVKRQHRDKAYGKIFGKSVFVMLVTLKRVFAYVFGMTSFVCIFIFLPFLDRVKRNNRNGICFLSSFFCEPEGHLHKKIFCKQTRDVRILDLPARDVNAHLKI